MNNNLLIGLIVAAVVILGGAMFVIYGTSPSSSITTTTPDTLTDTGTNTITTTTTTTVASAPLVTTGTLVVVSKSVAVVTGYVTPNGSQTSYWYEYGTTNSLGSRVGSQAVGSGHLSIATPAFINGLSANTLYYYRLSAQNALGTVTGQAYSFTTNNNPPIQGIGPTTRTDPASAVARTSASVNGHVNPNNAETTYWFEYGETTELGNTTSFQSAGNGTVSQSFSMSITNLKPLTKYYFRVNAQNQFGTMTGGTMTFTTSGPAASVLPTVVTTAAGNVATSSVTMRGRLNPNNYSTTYWFEYSTDSLLGSILGSSAHVVLTGNAAVNVSADAKALTPNTKYYYQLVATNAGGTVRGDIVTFTTKKLPGNNNN